MKPDRRCFKFDQLSHSCVGTLGPSNIHIPVLDRWFAESWSCKTVPKSSIRTQRENSSSPVPTASTLLLNPSMGSLPRSESEEVVTVNVHAAKELIASGKHRYLDVRTVEEFNKGHPEENALNIPYVFFTPEGRVKNPEFVDQVLLACDKEDHIVVGCQSGVRSLSATADLLSAGLKHVKNMGGGYLSWVENGYLVKELEQPKSSDAGSTQN